ncbi:MAG: C40 family peptidase [Ginsengibacter sp.]
MKHFAGLVAILLLIFFLESCSASRKSTISRKAETENTININRENSKKIAESNKLVAARIINTKNKDAEKVVDFAKTLVGTRYKYGSAIKENGFDCSGFVTYVFNHFNISVPRVSKDFTNAGTPVPLDKTKKGDLILFTGTDTTGWVVGHMGFITENDNGRIKFIHSSSGKSIGVIISEMSKYYATRFVKAIRVFDE